MELSKIFLVYFQPVNCLRQIVKNTTYMDGLFMHVQYLLKRDVHRNGFKNMESSVEIYTNKYDKFNKFFCCIKTNLHQSIKKKK